MTCGIRRTSPFSRIPRLLATLYHLLCPRAVAAIETLAVIRVIESPPACHSRELAPTEAVCLSACGYGGEEVEEVEYNAFPGV